MFIVMTEVTYLDAAEVSVASRDMFSNDTFIDLPFTLRTVNFGKDSNGNGMRSTAGPHGHGRHG